MTVPITEPAAAVVQTTSTTPPFTLPPAVDPDKIFTADDLHRARQEEKDKLYGRLETLGTQVSTLAQEREERLAQERLAEEAAAEAARLQREQEETLAERIERQQAEFQTRLDEERRQRQLLEVTLQKEREYADLQAYRSQALHAAADDILPELVDYVVGNTPAEIDASIQGLIDRSTAIIENAVGAMQQQRQAAPGVRVTSPPLGALETQAAVDGEPSPEQLAAMPMHEFAAYRQRHGIGQAANNRGLFG